MANNKSKLTLVVDGNWLLMSRQAVIYDKYGTDEQLCHKLKSLMISSLNLVLKQFPKIDNIIFVSDGGSWRANVEIPSFLVNKKFTPEMFEEIKQMIIDYAKNHPFPYDIESLNVDNCTLDFVLGLDGFDTSQLSIKQIEYKANRVPDPNKNWDLIFGAYEDFIATLNTTGITAVREPGIEGDDWCWYWANKLNAEGTNVIIWSKDKDLTQLVRTNSDKCFTICWNKEGGVTAQYVDEETMDFLFNPAYNENADIFQSIVSKSKGVNYIDPNTVVIDKIIRGDAGDNIMPAVTRKGKNESNTKVYKVSPKDLKIDLDIYNENEIREYFTNLLSSKNYIGRTTVSVNEAVEHFMYNRTLVVLDKSSYPQQILDKLNEYDTYNCSKNLTEASNIIEANSNSIKNILEII